MKITELLDIDSIDLSPQVTDKEEAIYHLIDLLDQSGKLNNKEFYKESVLNREKQSTTGIGDGVASLMDKVKVYKQLDFQQWLLKKD